MFDGRNIQSIFVLAMFAIFIANVSIISAATPVTACGSLTSANTVYTLSNDISSAGSCFSLASGSTLDCLGHSVTGDGTGTGVSTSTGSVVTNCVIVNFSIGAKGAASVSIIGNNFVDIYTGFQAGYRGNGLQVISNMFERGNRVAYIVSSSNDAIRNNTIINYTGDILTLASGSTGDVVSGNTIINGGARGIVTWTSGHRIDSNHIQTAGRALDIPWGLTQNSQIYNNFFDGAVYVAGSTPYNTWNVSKQTGPNIAGGPFLGGNYYLGFSDVCTDADADGFCDSPKTFNGNNVDNLPLSIFGCTDADNDTYSPDGGFCGEIDCDDADASTHPGASDISCNGIDNNCDGQIDEAYVSMSCGTGICVAPSTCVAGVESCTPGASSVENTVATCIDNLDNDCDALIDTAQDPDCAPGVAAPSLPSCTIDQMLDLDGNGVVDIDDAIFILRSVVGLPNQLDTVSKECVASPLSIV